MEVCYRSSLEPKCPYKLDPKCTPIKKVPTSQNLKLRKKASSSFFCFFPLERFLFLNLTKFTCPAKHRSTRKTSFHSIQLATIIKIKITAKVWAQKQNIDKNTLAKEIKGRRSHLRVSGVSNDLPFLRLQKPRLDKNKLGPFGVCKLAKTRKTQESGLVTRNMSNPALFFDFSSH